MSSDTHYSSYANGSSSYSWKDRFRFFYQSGADDIQPNPYLQREAEQSNDYAWIGDEGSETSTQTSSSTVADVTEPSITSTLSSGTFLKKELDVTAFDREDIQKGHNASHAFGSLLFQLLSEFQGDFVFAPQTVSVLLTVILASSEGVTSDQVSESLPWKKCCGLSLVTDIQRTFHGVANTTSEGMVNANFLFIHEGKRVNSVFLDNCQKMYNIKVRAIDSSSSSDCGKSITTVLNRTTKSKTLSCSLGNDHHWKENDPGVVFVSSSIFTARFPPQYLESTISILLPFYVLGKMRIQTEYLLMSWSKDFDVWRTNQFAASVIRIPLETKSSMNHSLLILLPDRDQTLNKVVENRLFIQDLLESIKSDVGKESKKTLILPKFLIRRTLYLHEYLPFLGMINAFDPDAAQLTGLSSYERISISGFFHETVVEIDMTTVPETPIDDYFLPTTETKNLIVVDRPFLYAIHDKGSGAVNVLGRVSTI
jgi:serpin B